LSKIFDNTANQQPASLQLQDIEDTSNNSSYIIQLELELLEIGGIFIFIIKYKI